MNRIQNPTDLYPNITSAGAGNGINHFPIKPKPNDFPAEEIELNLGLSLNGKFGSEPQRSAAKENNNNKLIRSSSVSSFVLFPEDAELSLNSPLTRTCSLPPETDMEWRKRKELQTLRRSEAKRRRVEKLKNGMKQCSPSPSCSKPPPVPVPAPVSVRSQGSIGSQESGGSSSGVSDLEEKKPFPGTNKETSETNEGSKLNKAKCNPKMQPEKHHAYDQTMPCVSTKGDGPDGKRIQGFLYRYGKDEEVRIVCVCHGSFLTPAEFVKHGGGGDVEHPLRHILVTSLFR